MFHSLGVFFPSYHIILQLGFSLGIWVLGTKSWNRAEKYKNGWQLELDHGFQNLIASGNTCFWEDYNTVLRFLLTSGIKNYFGSKGMCGTNDWWLLLHAMLLCGLWRRQSMGTAHSLCLPTHPFYTSPAPNCRQSCRQSYKRDICLPCRQSYLHDKKDNQQQGMSNTYFLWMVSCWTRKKSLSILLELPVRVSSLPHCPRTRHCVSLSFLLTSYLVLLLIVRN